MSEIVPVREVIERLVKQTGIRKKLAVEILHVIPEIIEEGLKRDGEVRVKGLGTFRLKWTKGRTGRNPKTGEKVEIPAHNRLVFLPEQSFKEYINRDNRLLSYKIIPSIAQEPAADKIIPEPQPQPQPEPENLQAYRYKPVLEPQPEPEPEPELPAARRRIHWIVPVAIFVVVILFVVFYFRNFYQSEKKSEVDSSQVAVPSSQVAVPSSQPAVSGQQPAEPMLNSELKTQNSILSTQNSELRTLTEGQHLFQLAREVYGNPYIWVLIYKENQAKIPDPDMLFSGVELIIPKLEGTPEKLSKNDSLAVSEGYRLVYEFYKAKGDSRAEDFYRAMERYTPK